MSFVHLSNRIFSFFPLAGNLLLGLKGCFHGSSTTPGLLGILHIHRQAGPNLWVLPSCLWAPFPLPVLWREWPPHFSRLHFLTGSVSSGRGEGASFWSLDSGTARKTSTRQWPPDLGTGSLLASLGADFRSLWPISPWGVRLPLEPLLLTQSALPEPQR